MAEVDVGPRDAEDELQQPPPRARPQHPPQRVHRRGAHGGLGGGGGLGFFFFGAGFEHALALDEVGEGFAPTPLGQGASGRAVRPSRHGGRVEAERRAGIVGAVASAVAVVAHGLLPLGLLPPGADNMAKVQRQRIAWRIV